MENCKRSGHDQHGKIQDVVYKNIPFFSFKSSNNSSVFEYPEKGEKFTVINCVLISYVMALFSSQCLLQVTLKLTKLWTPEIFMERYYVARNEPVRREITKPQTATVISL